MSGSWPALDRGRGQCRATELRMRRCLQLKALNLLQDAPRAFEGIDPAPGRGTVRCLSLDGDVEVNAPLVANRNLVPGANADDRVSQRSFQIGRCAFDRIVSAGLASRQNNEHQPALKRAVLRRVFDRTQ